MTKNAANTRSFLKDFFTLAAPIALGNLFTFGVGFSSHFMTAALGSEESLGIFLSNQIFLILSFAIGGIEAALSIVGSQALGGGDDRGFRSAVKKSAAIALIISLSLTILCIFAPKIPLSVLSPKKFDVKGASAYLRACSIGFPLWSLGRVLISAMKCSGKPSVALFAPLTALCVNFGLGTLLIDGGRGMGSLGAGIALLCARVAELGVTLLYAAILSLRGAGSKGENSGAQGSSAKGESAGLKLSDLCAQGSSAKGSGATPLWRVLLPITVGQAAWAAESLFATAMMSRAFGGSGAVAFGVATALSNLAYALMNGASSATGIRISRTVGEGADGKKIMREAELAQLCFITVGLLCSIAILALGEPFALLYRLSEVESASLWALIPTLAVSFAACAYSAASLFGILKSGGDVGFVLVVDLLGLLLITLPLSLSAAHLGSSAAQLYAALRAVHLFKCPAAHARIRAGRWWRRLTKAS